MRQKRVKLSFFLLERIFTEGSILPSVKCIKGIPEGTKFIRLIDNFACNQYDLVIEHESFPILKEGDIIPYHDDVQFIKLEEE